MTILATRDQSPQLAAPVRQPLRLGQAGRAGLTPRDVWRIIRKRKWLIILTFVICMAIAGTATLLWWMFAPWYTAAGLVKVQPPPETMMRVTARMYTKEIIEREKRSQAQLVKHHGVLDNAAKDENLKKTNWYKKHKKYILQELDEQIDVSLMPDTYFIRLSMTGMNRDELATIVNAMINSFLKYTKDNARRGRGDIIKKLRDARNALEGKRDGIRREMSDARRASSVAGMQDRHGIVAITLQMLIPAIHEARIELSEADSAMAGFEESVKNNTLMEDPQVLFALENDYSLRTLKVRLADMETALDNAVSKFGEKHRSIKNIKGMIEAVKKQIAARKAEVIQIQLMMIGQMRKGELDGATKKLADLIEVYTKAEIEAKQLEESLGRIEALRRQAEDTEESITIIDKQLTDLSMMRGRPGEEEEEIGPVSIGALATVPRKEQPSQPKWSVMMPLGALLGLVLGFGLAFLLEFVNTSVSSPSDLARRVDLPLLGMVPHSDDLDEEIDDFRRATLVAPHSPAAEAFRQIRTNLLFSGPAEQRRSLLVTSPSPQDGRTTVVMNLAASMAQAGRRVLLVDANFHRPAIAEMFPSAHGGNADAGLSSTLVGQAAWGEVVSATDVPNLSIIPAGPLPPNPAELLGSDTMRQIVSEMTEEYDQVIFDGSPVMVVADACVLSKQVDGVILVVRAGVNSVGIVQRSAERLSRIGARVFGVVLQGVRTVAGGYLRKNYETFYDYHQKILP